MTPPVSQEAAKKEKGAEPGYAGRALATLLPNLWPRAPAENWLELRVRVLAAMASLVLAKVTVVYVPILFKEAVDALSVKGNEAVVAVPLARCSRRSASSKKIRPLDSLNEDEASAASATNSGRSVCTTSAAR